MKKILTLAIVGIASFAQALSFDWASAAKISFNGETTIAQAGGITAKLIYLGTDTSATVTKRAPFSAYTIFGSVSPMPVSISPASTGHCFPGKQPGRSRP